MDKKNLWQIYDEAELTRLEEVNQCYRECLDEGKTERECVAKTIRMARAAGYRDIREAIAAKKEGKEGLKAGDKVYAVYAERGHRTVPDRKEADRRRNEHPGRAHRFSQDRSEAADSL